MFELETATAADLKMIEFGTTVRDTRKVLFELPVLGQPGLPMALTSAFTIFYDRFSSSRAFTEGEVAQAWTYFIQTLADLYPDATRQLGRLDETQLSSVIEHWVKESSNFDPKA
jgi:hypothetical protein